MTSLEPAYEEIFKSWYSDLPEVDRKIYKNN